MPTRILREGIITSEAVNRLSHETELFYRRLMSVVDDYGRFFSHPAIVRASCYPLQLHLVSESDVKQMISECTANALLLLYGGQKYLQIQNFRQQTRAKSKFPDPETLITCIANDNQMCSESEANAKSKSETYHRDSRIVLRWLNEKTGRHFRELDTNLSVISARLSEPEVTLDGVKLMISRQCRRWKGTAQEEYLRPETLFGKSKFDSYYAAKELPIHENHAGNSAKPNPRNIGIAIGPTDYGEAAKRKLERQALEAGYQAAPKTEGT